LNLGIGAIFDTPTKSLTTTPCGIKGLRDILKVVSLQASCVKVVAIGGLNAGNIARIRFQSETPSSGSKLDGVAVVRALMSAGNPYEAASQLKKIFQETPPFIHKQNWTPQKDLSVSGIRDEIARILQTVQKETPLVHHLTNNVWSSTLITHSIGGQKLLSEHSVGYRRLPNHV
jgi:thiamine-phosphate diphosphorylase / hydroxyethylthiazole kinase